MSDDVIIRAEGLGKRYNLGASVEMFGSFREAMMTIPRMLLGKGRGKHGAPAADAGHLALRNVGFEIRRGEVVGVIGRNGAGKSTLLKILSQITAPTEGSADIYGRLSSLLEVGTGFHPELTGRENIYLNGSILGMRKTEIERNFDEIVAFAEVDKFLDTPVKRYSSGMYVRLAFAVAAHLQPEVLVVDEVLAVGDQSFQRKCLGKMRDIGSGGRTVLFVSHNLAAIQALCSKALYLDKGMLVRAGEAGAVIEEYIAHEPVAVAGELRDRADRRGEGGVRSTAIRIVHGETGRPFIQSGDPVRFEVDYESAGPQAELALYIGIDTTFIESLIILYSQESGLSGVAFPARGTMVCEIARLPLPAGNYPLRVRMCRGNAGHILDLVENAATLEVHGGDFFGTGQTVNLGWSTVLVDQRWHVEPATATE